jgi:hypothetical protein
VNYCCKCHKLTEAQIAEEMAAGTMDEVCPDDINHNCDGLCPCEFTEAEAVGVLRRLDFEVVEREQA